MRERAPTATATRTRRDFLTRGDRSEIHVASVLVHARPEDVEMVAARLTRLSGVESHGSNGAGKLILTIEADGDDVLVERMTRIETDDSVIAATLVYHHAEELTDEEGSGDVA